MTRLAINDLPDAEERFALETCIGTGIFGKVHSAIDTASGNKKVAIKIQTLNSENENYINEEYKVLRDFSNHFNLPDYYSAYKREQNDISEIWFVMEVTFNHTYFTTKLHHYLFSYVKVGPLLIW